MQEDDQYDNDNANVFASHNKYKGTKNKYFDEQVNTGNSLKDYIDIDDDLDLDIGNNNGDNVGNIYLESEEKVEYVDPRKKLKKVEKAKEIKNIKKIITNIIKKHTKSDQCLYSQ